MPYGQNDPLQELGGQYAPIASGVPFQPMTGFEGLPFGGGMTGLLMMGPLRDLMGRAGMAPMGLHDRNVYDVMQNHHFWQMQQQLQRQMAESDRDSWMRTMRGIASMTGTPFGVEQMRAARSLTDAAVVASPILQMIAPDLLDEMAGQRGSAAVMAGRMMMASRYRIDPVTGRLGQDPSQVAATSQRLFREMYEDGDPSRMEGISAGQFGQIYESLQARGMVPGSRLSPRDSVRRLARTDERLIRQAGMDAGIDIPDNVRELRPQQLDQLLATPAVGDKMRSFESDRVKQSLQGYLKAVNAVRDIFGDIGQPNAPMAQLLNALDALTNGSVAQIQPGQLNMMVRMTHQLAQATGVGLEGALMMQQHASSRAAAMGVEPIFAIQANQGAMAFGGAYRAMGFGSIPSWGAMNADQLQQMDANLRVNAVASRAAMRMGLAVRLNETLGGFENGSSAAAYVEALRTAQDTGSDQWFDPVTKRQRNMNLSQSEFFELFTSAKLNNGQASPVTVGGLESMMNQTSANREFVQQFGLGDVVRRAQGKADVRPWLAGQLQGYMPAILGNAGVDPDVARSSVTRDMTRRMVDRIMDMDPDDFRDNTRRNQRMGEIFKDVMGKTPGGMQALAQKGDRFFDLAANDFFGFADRVIRLSPDFHDLGGMQNMFALFNEGVQHQAVRIQQQERVTARIRDAMAPLNRGGMVRRAMSYLQSVNDTGQNQNQIAGLISASLGGVNIEDVRGKLMPEMAKIKVKQAELEELRNRLGRAETDGERAGIIRDIDAREQDLRAIVGKTQDVMGRMGVADDMLTTEETAKAVNLTARVGEYDVVVKAFATETDPAKRREKFSDFWRSDSGKLYTDAVRGQAQAAGDVATKLALSDSSTRRFGTAGIESARTIQEQNQRLRELALIHTGGDIARLTAGDFDPSISKDKAGIITEEVGRAVKLRNEAVQKITDMQKTAGRSWGDLGAMAKDLGVAKSDVELAYKLDDADARKLTELKDLGARLKTAKEEHRDTKTLQERYDRAHDEIGVVAGRMGTDTAGLERAGGVFDKLYNRAENLRRREHTPGTALAKQFLESYGVTVPGTEADQQKLGQLGQMMSSESGRAFAYALMAGQGQLAKAGKLAGLKGPRDVDVVDAMYKDYQSGGFDKFSQKYGRSTAESMRLQEATGFARFGDPTGGVRTDFDIGKGVELMGRVLSGGKLEGSGATQVELKEGTTLKISGRLEHDGSVSGTGTIDNQHAQSINAAPSGGG